MGTRQAKGILVDMRQQDQGAAMQRMREHIREESVIPCGALIAGDLNYTGPDSFTFIDMQIAMQELVIAVEDRRALRSGEVGSTPEEVAAARAVWKAAFGPSEEVDQKLIKAFGLCTTHWIGCDC
jgi:hypothetical protein